MPESASTPTGAFLECPSISLSLQLCLYLTVTDAALGCCPTLCGCRFMAVDMALCVGGLIAHAVLPILLMGRLQWVVVVGPVRFQQFRGLSNGFPWASMRDPINNHKAFCVPLLILACRSAGQWCRLHPLTNETPVPAAAGNTRTPNGRCGATMWIQRVCRISFGSPCCVWPSGGYAFWTIVPRQHGHQPTYGYCYVQKQNGSLVLKNSSWCVHCGPCRNLTS